LRVPPFAVLAALPRTPGSVDRFVAVAEDPLEAAAAGFDRGPEPGRDRAAPRRIAEAIVGPGIGADLRHAAHEVDADAVHRVGEMARRQARHFLPVAAAGAHKEAGLLRTAGADHQDLPPQAQALAEVVDEARVAAPEFAAQAPGSAAAPVALVGEEGAGIGGILPVPQQQAGGAADDGEITVERDRPTVAPGFLGIGIAQRTGVAPVVSAALEDVGAAHRGAADLVAGCAHDDGVARD